jgi:hypothetical protein
MTKYKKDIDALEKQLAELKRLQDEYDKESPERRLADAMHSGHCRWNHTDGCDWAYDRGNWQMESRKRYLAAATRILNEYPRDLRGRMPDLAGLIAAFDELSKL